MTLLQKGSFKRNKLNTTAEHFLDYIFDSGLLQDVAYGINKLQYDRGNIQVLPKAIITCKYSQLIEFYQNFCKESDYQPEQINIMENFTYYQTITTKIVGGTG